MFVKLWGVRGSLPRAETPEQLQNRIISILQDFEAAPTSSASDYIKGLAPQFLGGYGGNTSCMEVTSGEDQLIIDCGSGIKDLGMGLMSGPAGKGQGKIHILLTHFHWDHLIGIPFFVPIFIPGNEIHFYAVQHNFQEYIQQMFRKPYFPVDYDWLPSNIHFHQLSPRKKIEIANFDVTPYQLDHPDPCWGFRVDKDGRSYAHCVDTEATRISREDLGEDIGLYEDVNLMVFDGQYTLVEVIEKVNWGHAVAGLGLDIAMRENIERVAFVHHDPYATQEKIQQAIKQTEVYYDLRMKECKAENMKVFDVDWFFGHEGMVLEV